MRLISWTLRSGSEQYIYPIYDPFYVFIFAILRTMILVNNRRITSFTAVANSVVQFIDETASEDAVILTKYLKSVLRHTIGFANYL
jgi:hypothetical protein